MRYMHLPSQESRRSAGARCVPTILIPFGCALGGNAQRHMRTETKNKTGHTRTKGRSETETGETVPSAHCEALRSPHAAGASAFASGGIDSTNGLVRLRSQAHAAVAVWAHYLRPALAVGVTPSCSTPPALPPRLTNTPLAHPEFGFVEEMHVTSCCRT